MPYRKIMVPLDGSLLAEYILPQVEELASALGSRVSLVHVIPSGDPVLMEPTPSQRDRRAHISNYLSTLAGQLEQKGLNVQWDLRVGNPVPMLLEYARREGIDLVVMSTHGQGASYHRRVGSVAAELLEGIGTPLLLVRVPESIARL